MINLHNISKIYFIGIGGIGMSALARYFNSLNVAVYGYDRKATALCLELEKEGMQIHYEDNIDLIPMDVDLVVYTPAIPSHHFEMNYYRDNGYLVVKRSDILQAITEKYFNICVAGTHGKTTISSMVAFLLSHTGYGCNAFLGGISANYNSNFWADDNETCVVEADEFDRSFLKLSPDIAVISAMDADHLDIYGTEEEIQNAFVAFSKRLKPGGLLISKFGLSRSSELQNENHLTYSLQNNAAELFAANIRMDNGTYEFDVLTRDWMIDNVRLNMGGMHNIENMLVAIFIAHHLGIKNEKIREAVAAYKGVRRRFEYVVKSDAVVYIDDYAHHPEELKALITSAKTLFSDKKCTLVFQPHLFSRTNDFADEFAESLDLADEVLLLPIYPARELPMEGVTSKIIIDRMENENHFLLSKEEVLEKITASEIELLITAGAGDIDELVKPIKTILAQHG